MIAVDPTFDLIPQTPLVVFTSRSISNVVWRSNSLHRSFIIPEGVRQMLVKWSRLWNLVVLLVLWCLTCSTAASFVVAFAAVVASSFAEQQLKYT